MGYGTVIGGPDEDGPSINWRCDKTAECDTVAGYRVSRWNVATKDEPLHDGLLPAETHAYTDTTAARGTTHFYTVEAVRADGSIAGTHVWSCVFQDRVQPAQGRLSGFGPKLLGPVPQHPALLHRERLRRHRDRRRTASGCTCCRWPAVACTACAPPPSPTRTPPTPMWAPLSRTRPGGRRRRATTGAALRRRHGTQRPLTPRPGRHVRHPRPGPDLVRLDTLSVADAAALLARLSAG